MLDDRLSALSHSKLYDYITQSPLLICSPAVLRGREVVGDPGKDGGALYYSAWPGFVGCDRCPKSLKSQMLSYRGTLQRMWH